jgi:hypothetical protein
VRTPRKVTVLAIVTAVLAVASTTAAVVHRGEGSPPAAIGSPGVPDPAPVPPPVATDDIAPPTEATPVPRGEEALTPVQRASRLRRYSSCDAFLTATRREALARVGPYGLPGADGIFTTGLVAGGDVRAGGASARPSSGGDAAQGMAASDGGNLTGGGAMGEAGGYSGTNVQEKGIDEPDTVETDGRRLFTLARGRLFYATVTDGTARIDGSIEVPGAQELVLVGDRAVVFGYRSSVGPEHAGYGGVHSVITVIDVRTPAMGVVSSLVFTGQHVSARVVDGVVRAVVRSHPSALPFTYPDGSGRADEQAAAARNRRIVAAAPLSAWIAPLVVEDGRRRVRSTRSLVDCRATYRPQRFSGFGMLTVLTFDPRDPDAVTSATVHADGDRVYASRDRLYVATNGWQSVMPDSREVVTDPETLVHAFDISDAKQARYTSSGRVQGTTIGQFAFSEHEGFLRVATTKWGNGATALGTEASESWVTVLRDNGAVLEQVGRVGGLGKGERIYAVRFIGPVGYIVTFRQVDPLYVVDLSNPRAPEVTGELKIEGYSAYLHPIGPGLLLGVGRDATPEGRAQGVQVSVFDVSDPARPTRLHHLALPGSGSSSVEHDHHAFLWWAPTNLAVVPVSEVDSEGRFTSGVLGLTATREAMRQAGRISRPGTSHPIERTVVVGTTLFTVSQGGIGSATLATMAERGWTAFPDA